MNEAIARSGVRVFTKYVEIEPLDFPNAKSIVEGSGEFTTITFGSEREAKDAVKFLWDSVKDEETIFDVGKLLDGMWTYRAKLEYALVEMENFFGPAEAMKDATYTLLQADLASLRLRIDQLTKVIEK